MAAAPPFCSPFDPAKTSKLKRAFDALDAPYGGRGAVPVAAIAAMLTGSVAPPLPSSDPASSSAASSPVSSSSVSSSSGGHHGHHGHHHRSRGGALGDGGGAGGGLETAGDALTRDIAERYGEGDVTFFTFLQVQRRAVTTIAACHHHDLLHASSLRLARVFRLPPRPLNDLLTSSDPSFL